MYLYCSGTSGWRQSLRALLVDAHPAISTWNPQELERRPMTSAHWLALGNPRCDESGCARTDPPPLYAPAAFALATLPAVFPVAVPVTPRIVQKSLASLGSLMYA